MYEMILSLVNSGLTNFHMLLGKLFFLCRFVYFPVYLQEDYTMVKNTLRMVKASISNRWTDYKLIVLPLTDLLYTCNPLVEAKHTNYFNGTKHHGITFCNFPSPLDISGNEAANKVANEVKNLFLCWCFSWTFIQ